MADFANRLIVRGALLVAALAWTAEVVGQQPPPPPPPGPPPSQQPQAFPTPTPYVPVPVPVKLPFEVVIAAPKEVTARRPLCVLVQVKNVSEKSFANVQLIFNLDVENPRPMSMANQSIKIDALGPLATRTLPMFLELTAAGTAKISVASHVNIVERSVAAVVKINPLGGKIDANASVDDLLPRTPKMESPAMRRLAVKLAEIPEVSTEETPGKAMKQIEALDHVAGNVAKVKHANKKNRDGYMEALLAKRRDLAGLPFAMGDACRMTEGRRFQLGLNSLLLRQAASPPVALNAPPAAAVFPGTVLPTAPEATTEGSIALDESGLLKRFQDALAKAEAKALPSSLVNPDDVARERIAAVMQILGPEPAEHRRELVQYLATIQHAEATRALAKLAIFSEERDIREAAVTALKVRRERDYTDILLKGLSYPWPAVARRSAEAIHQLERTDLIPKLLDMLEQPDPRAPRTKTVNGTTVAEVRELVRINHHRNCLLCHAPAPESREGLSKEMSEVAPALFVRMPLPGQELPPSSPSGYYDDSIPEILVRADVTYLRQDFSVKLPVADAQPWPEMQRFDFVVRTREVTAEEAKALSALLEPREPGVLSEYHRAALFALREMTGRDTAPTAAAWRKLLGL